MTRVVTWTVAVPIDGPAVELPYAARLLAVSVLLPNDVHVEDMVRIARKVVTLYRTGPHGGPREIVFAAPACRIPTGGARWPFGDTLDGLLTVGRGTKLEASSHEASGWQWALLLDVVYDP